MNQLLLGKADVDLLLNNLGDLSRITRRLLLQELKHVVFNAMHREVTKAWIPKQHLGNTQLPNSGYGRVVLNYYWLNV